MYSMHIGNGITALVGLLDSIIGISAIMHFGNGGLLNREEFYLYCWWIRLLVHLFIILFQILKQKLSYTLTLPPPCERFRELRNRPYVIMSVIFVNFHHTTK